MPSWITCSANLGQAALFGVPSLVLAKDQGSDPRDMIKAAEWDFDGLCHGENAHCSILGLLVKRYAHSDAIHTIANLTLPM